MKKLTLLVSALVLLAATGCAGQTDAGTAAPGPATSPAQAAAATPTPTVEPTPEVLSDEEAGEVYLDRVCPRNELVRKMFEMVDATFVGDQFGYYNGSALDLKAAKKLVTSVGR